MKYPLAVVIVIIFVLIVWFNTHPHVEMLEVGQFVEVNGKDVEILPLSELRDELQTGDVLCSMGTNLQSGLIRTFLGSPITHVSMVIRASDCEVPLVHDLYILDIGLNEMPVVGDIYTKDVQLRPLDAVISMGGSHYIYGVVPRGEFGIQELRITAEDIYRYKRVNFNWSPWSMFSTDDKDYKVCSTFVQDIHKNAGIMHDCITPVDYFNRPGLKMIDARF